MIWSPLAFALAAAVTAGIAPHDPGLSSIRITRTGDGIVVHAAFANADFRGATLLDVDGDGRLRADELVHGDAAIRRVVRDGFVLRVGGVAMAGELVATAIAENDDVELVVRHGAVAGDAILELSFLARLARGHRCYIALLGDGEDVLADALLRPTAAAFVLPAANEPGGAGVGQAMQFLVFGVEHILIGFDHLAFLLALLVAGSSLGRVVATITAFTVAHSVTLVAAALGVVRLPGLLVEAVIAASIVVVALANLLQRGQASHRWPLAFGFGLVHGFGFASVLADLSIERASVLPLLTFNLGVELGQLAFAACVVPLLGLASRRGHAPVVATVVSIAVGIAGTCWLVERLLA